MASGADAVSTGAVPSEEDSSLVESILAKQLGFPSEAARALLACTQWRTVQRGEQLFAQGDSSPNFFLLLSGRLKGLRHGMKGPEFAVWFRPGEIIGELGFFGQSARTLDVVAIRTSRLLVVDQQVLDQAAQQSQQVYQHILRILAQRFKSQMGYTARSFPQKLVVIIPLIPNTAQRQRVQFELAKTLAQMPQVSLHKHAEHLAFGLEALGQRTPSSQVLYLDDPSKCPDWLLDELDDVVLLVDHQTTIDGAVAATLKEWSTHLDEAVRWTLVHVHPGEKVEPGLTANWVKEMPNCKHLHWRLGAQGDASRMARTALGRGFGLVLGGGGARGFAHAGIYRALVEAGLEPDLVGGTSMGALVGALIASGARPKEVESTLQQTFKKGLPFRWRDYLFPKHGFIRSASVDRVYQQAFGQQRIEDLPLPYFAVGCNLSQGSEELIQRGEVWRSIRVSTSIPVLFEPCITEHEVLVDGALVNNVPVDRMRLAGAHRILTVDVSQEEDIRATHHAGRTQLPGLLKALTRMVELGGIEKSREARVVSDVYVKPPVDVFGMLDFHKAEAIIDIGYQAGLAIIVDLKQKLAE